MPQHITLNHYWRSSSSWRVRWALEIKGKSYSSRPINLLKNEQLTPAYLAKSPLGLVPTLTYQGQSLTGSIAIIEWLEERYPTPALLPSNPWDKAKVRELASIIYSDTQPVQNLRIMRRHSSDPNQQQRWAYQAIEHGLTAFEQLLRSCSGSFCWGGQLTLADLCLIPQVYNAHRFKVDMGKFPICERIYRTCLALPSCDRAAPHNQPGATP